MFIDYLCLCAEVGDPEIAEAMLRPGPLLETGRELWRDFFSLTPATSLAAPGTGLDFIAP
jgi:hypothetical protein